MPVLFIDSGGVVEATYRDSQTSGAGASHTFTGMSVGPASGGRYVVACLAWSVNARTLVSVTIGGVSATVAATVGPAGLTNVAAAMAVALVPTGITADVVLTLSGSSDDAACVTYSMLGVSSAVAAGTATSTSADPTGSLSCQAGGAIIGCALSVNNPIRTAAWAGIDEDVEAAPYGSSGTRKFTAAHSNFLTTQSSLACTCTFSGASSGGSGGVFAAFNPS